MKTLATAFRSRGSVAADRLIFTSGSVTADRLIFTNGLYVIVTAGDDANGHWDGTAASAIKCGRAHGLCTADKAKSLKMWEEYTANHIAR